MADTKLVGQNYTTPDLLAKVTGRSKYAEDFRAEGMLFAKLLLSPLPHARVRSVDTSAAEAIPGVRAILRAAELPAPADTVTDLGETIRANPMGEKALTDEPVYAGEPVLAVAAVDEETACAAIEAIRVDWEPLPFVVDPLVALRPDGPNPRAEGNTWGRPPAEPGKPPGPLVRCSRSSGRRRTSPSTTRARCRWASRRSSGPTATSRPASRNAALVLDETFSMANNQHHVLEPRTALAYWRGEQAPHAHRHAERRADGGVDLALDEHAEPENVVLITEYTGGGFGSRATGAVICMVPALLAKKANAPVMMRITREEEQYIGGIRPGMHGRVKAGFAKDGRLLALDLFLIGENSAYEAQGDAAGGGRFVSLLYQPVAMRSRAITVLTNTPPRRAQSQPGGLQAIMMIEPVVAKAARQLGVDQVAIRRLNAPEGKAKWGPANPQGERGYATSAFVKEALDRGGAALRLGDPQGAIG